MRSSMTIFLALHSLILIANAPANGQNGSKVKIAYSLSSAQVTLHEPILMTVTITNDLSAALTVDLGQDQKEAIELSIRGPDGKVITSALPRHDGVSRIGTVQIPSGQTYKQTIVLNEWYSFDAIGKYEIAAHIATFPGQQGQLANGLDSSATLPLEILPRDSQQLDKVCAGLKDKIERSASYTDMREAALALSYIGDPVAVPYLQDAVLLHSGMVASIAIRGLARVDGTSGVGALILLSEQQDPTIRSLARTSLAHIMLGTKDSSLQDQIRQALGKQ